MEVHTGAWYNGFMEIDISIFYARLGSIGLILLLGFFLGKLRLISEQTNRQLANLLLTVFMPASLFSAFPATYDENALGLSLSGLGAGALVMTVLILLSLVIFNKKFYKEKGLRYESQFALIFNNATFLGYPIVASTFHADGILAYSGFIIAFNIALFSYGIWLFTHKMTWKLVVSMILNPNIIAVLLGMVFFLVGFSLPEFVNDAVRYVGGATTPLSIICIGFMLSRAKFSEMIKKWRLMLTSVIQLVLCPLVTFGLLTLLRFPAEVIAVCTLIQTLPTATSLGLFAAKYGGNEAEASELVTISTTFSVITMPLLMWLLTSI